LICCVNRANINDQFTFGFEEKSCVRTCSNKSIEDSSIEVDRLLSKNLQTLTGLKCNHGNKKLRFAKMKQQLQTEEAQCHCLAICRTCRLYFDGIYLLPKVKTESRIKIIKDTSELIWELKSRFLILKIYSVVNPF